MTIAVRILFVCVIVVGGVFSFRKSRDVRELRAIHQDLKAKVGLIEIRDPTKVYVVPIAEPAVPLAIQNEVDRIWQFQLYVPPNYPLCFLAYSGNISADGTISQGGSSSHYSSGDPESIKGLLTIGLIREGENWSVSHSGPGGSSGSSNFSVSTDLSLNKMIIDSIDSVQSETIEFPVDAFFRILSIRDPESKKSRTIGNRSVKLHDGIAFWLGPQTSMSAMEAAKQGNLQAEDADKVMP